MTQSLKRIIAALFKVVYSEVTKAREKTHIKIVRKLRENEAISRFQI